MLGDVIKKGRSLESSRIRVWKAKNRLKRARQSVIDLLLLPRTLPSDMAEIALEMEEETAQRELEEAEFQYLCEREGENELTWERAKGRAATFALNVLLFMRKKFPEPMHPFFDVPMSWIHDQSNKFGWDEWDELVNGDVDPHESGF